MLVSARTGATLFGRFDGAAERKLLGILGITRLAEALVDAAVREIGGELLPLGDVGLFALQRLGIIEECLEGCGDLGVALPDRREMVVDVVGFQRAGGAVVREGGCDLSASLGGFAR